MRNFLKRLVVERLPAVMVTKNRNVVLYCLDIDADRQISGSAAIDEVLKKIEELAIGMQ